MKLCSHIVLGFMVSAISLSLMSGLSGLAKGESGTAGTKKASNSTTSTTKSDDSTTKKNQPDLAAGKKIFDSSCIACHAGGGNDLYPKKPLIGSPRLVSKDSLKSLLENPSGAMPTYHALASNNTNLSNLYAYVRSLDAASGLSTVANQTPDSIAGKKLFDANCASCHPSGKNVVKPQRPIKGSSKLTSKPALRIFLENPPSSMHPHKEITDSDVALSNLYSYLTSLK